MLSDVKSSNDLDICMLFCRPNGVLLQAVSMLWILLLEVEVMMLHVAVHIAFAGM